MRPKHAETTLQEPPNLVVRNRHRWRTNKGKRTRCQKPEAVHDNYAPSGDPKSYPASRCQDHRLLLGPRSQLGHAHRYPHTITKNTGRWLGRGAETPALTPSANVS